MALVPSLTKFTTAAEVVASYDWLDLTSGLGYRRYYPCSSTLSSGKSYFLSTKIMEAIPMSLTESHVVATTTRESFINLDFDITFNALATIGDGDAFVNLTHFLGNNCKCVVTINVYHVSTADVETSIGTIDSTIHNTGGGSEYFRESLKVPLTAKNFSKGEKLRFNVVIFAAPNMGGGTPTVTLYFDPSSIDTVTDGAGDTRDTDITFDLPFKTNA